MPITDPVRWPEVPPTLLTTPLTGTKKRTYARWQQHRAAYTSESPPAGMTHRYKSSRMSKSEISQRHAEMKYPPQERQVDRYFDARLNKAAGQQKRRSAASNRAMVLSQAQFKGAFAATLEDIDTHRSQIRQIQDQTRAAYAEAANKFDPYRQIGSLWKAQN